jgi:hypothetical protein
MLKKKWAHLNSSQRQMNYEAVQLGAVRLSKLKNSKSFFVA